MIRQELESAQRRSPSASPGGLCAVETRAGSRGMTLVELLVVIAVLGILMALLLPAIMAARTAARRTQCANNLKQLGLAVHSFHTRNDSLPSYWGCSKNAPGELFGPWLMHILPDLEEQPFYDQFSTNIYNTGNVVTVVRGYWSRGAEIAPQIPASADYVPGVWTPTTTVVQSPEVNFAGVSIVVTTTVTTWSLVGQVGTPPQGPWYDWSYIITSTDSLQFALGLHPNFPATQSLKSISLLQCGDDGRSVPAGTMVRARSQTTGALWSLTNYLANAHAFVRFSGTGANVTGPPRRLFGPSGQTSISDTMGGRFPRPWGRTTLQGGTNVIYHHGLSGTTSINPRTFDSITDGLSNTIMFGEAMRQCDNGRSYRYAFLPASEYGDEHSFGIDPSVADVLSASYGDGVNMGFGNTLMFQQRPFMEGCNKFRIQANHDVLNVAMCDGSVRGISPRVSRREQCDPDVAGREFGRQTYNAEGLGGVGTGSGSTQPNTIPDGIWDMLMVPNDPDGNVLNNTGEVGREQ